MSADGLRSLLRALFPSLQAALRGPPHTSPAQDEPSAETARKRVSELLAANATEGVSAEKLATAAPDKAETPYRLITETVSDVIVLHGPDRQAIYVSPSVKGMLGIEPAEFWLHDRVHRDDLAAVLSLDARTGTAGPGTVLAFRLRHADGRWIWAEAVTNRIALPGSETTVLLSTLRDVTDRHNKTDELRMARDAAELAQARAESTTRAKSEFIGLMSHEIRTPLTAIRGLVELLNDSGSLDRKQRRHLSLIEASTETLLVTVDDILDYARSETGDLRIEVGRFALPATIAAVVELVRPAASSKNIILDVGVARDLPEYVLGDERRLRQILLNLLNDAIGVAVGGTVSLSVQGARLGQKAGTLRISITAGVPEDQSPAYPVRAASLDGSGLGLTVAQRLVGLMGGRIDRTTRPGEAAAYRFSIVLQAARDVAAAQDHQPVSTRPARVLVAEDNVVDQEIVRAMLERSGYVVDLVGDGGAAMQAVQARTYDLVLMDVQMPTLDGVTATRRIRALQHPSRRVPIIALTADVMPQKIRSFADAGMSAYLAKPFTRKALIDAVATQLSTVVLLDTNEEPARPARPAVFDRSCYDALRMELGVDGAQGTLRAFIALVERGSEGPIAVEDARSVSACAARLGFLDLANAYDRLIAVMDGPDAEQALRLCRIARELAQRTFGELSSLERPEVTRFQALL